MIKKVATNKVKAEQSPLIKTVSIPEDSPHPVIIYAVADNSSHIERRHFMTKEAYKRVVDPSNVLHPTLSNGLRGVARFRFKVMLKEENDVTKVCGFHCLPTDNYLGCNFSAETEINLKPEHAAVQFLPTGEIDIWAYPAPFGRHIDKFLQKLEGLTSITNSTEFSCGDIRFTVHSFLPGGVAIFRCRKVRK